MIAIPYRGVFSRARWAQVYFGGVEEKVTALLQKLKGMKSKSSDADQNEY